MEPRERILLMGGWGVGKSTAIKDIAENYPDSRIFVIDTTFEGERNYTGVENIEVNTVRQWDDYMKAVQKAEIKGGREDWLAVDRIDPVWEMAQNAFIEKVFGKEADEWFVEFRRDSGGHPLAGEYGMNWVVIKKMYGAFMTHLQRFKGHIIVTTAAQQVTEPNRDGKGGDSQEVRAEYGKFGVRPAGEKNLGFLFHTVLLLAEPKEGQWIFTTIRDRNRTPRRGEVMKTFTESYLRTVAGWSTT